MIQVLEQPAAGVGTLIGRGIRGTKPFDNSFQQVPSLLFVARRRNQAAAGSTHATEVRFQ